MTRTAILAPLVAAHPDRPAVIDGQGPTTFAELDEQVARLVHALRDRGVGSGATVLALLGNQVEQIVTSLASLHGGWTLVPVNWHSVAAEVAYLIDDARPAAIVVDDRWAAVAADAIDRAEHRVGVRIGLTEAWGDVLASGAAEPVDGGARGGPMFYTSGTTGQPKGVRSAITGDGGPPEVFTLMAHSLGPIIDVPPAAEEPRVQLVCGPLYHSAQWVFAHFALVCGATVVLQHRFDAAEVLELVDRHGVTNTHLVPAQMSRLLDLPPEVRDRFDGSSLRRIFHGAAPCPTPVKRAMIEWVGPKVTEYYGGTEGGFISLIDADDWLERPGSVGRPLPIIEVEILDAEGVPQPPGTSGEIWFRNLLGSDFSYHDAPDKTASAHRAEMGTLGDVGFVDDDGFLHLSDRKIDMVVSGGVNIYPAEVESALVGHPDVVDAAVFGIPDDEMGERVHAAVVLRAGRTWDAELEASVDAHCRAQLAGYKRPRSYEIHVELPRSEAGKLSKRTLRDPWWAGRERAI